MTKGKVRVLGSNATRIEVQSGGTGPTGNYLNETIVSAREPGRPLTNLCSAIAELE